MLSDAGESHITQIGEVNLIIAQGSRQSGREQVAKAIITFGLSMQSLPKEDATCPPGEIRWQPAL